MQPSTAAATAVPTVGNDAIEILLNDHRSVKQILDRLPELSASEREPQLRRMKAMLTVHNATEENCVYPAIHELAGRHMHADTLYHQQDDAERHLWSLSHLDSADRDFATKAEALRDEILAHVESEETSEFPKLRDALSPTQLQMLTAEVRQFRDTFVAKELLGYRAQRARRRAGHERFVTCSGS